MVPVRHLVFNCRSSRTRPPARTGDPSGPSGVAAVWNDDAVQVDDWLNEMAASVPQVSGDDLASLGSALDAEATAVLDVGAVEDVVILSKSRLSQLERCERSAVATATGATAPEPPSPAALAGRALDHFIAHVLVGGRPGESTHDLRAALVAHGDHEALERLAEWEGTAEGAEFDRRVDALAAEVLDAWVGVDPSWAPRTQTSASLLLADGRLRVSGVLDVELGGPPTERPGVVVEVKSGRAGDHHRHETYLYGLLVALRDGGAPVSVARWYPGGTPAGVPVTIGTLEAAVERLLAGVGRWTALLGGRSPTMTPGVWCGWCPARDECEVAYVPGSTASAQDRTDEVEYTPEVEGEAPW